MSEYSANVKGDREWYADERPLPESTARQIFAQYKRHKRKATIKRLKTERMSSLLVEEADANEVDTDVRIRQVSKNRFNVEELSPDGGSSGAGSPRSIERKKKEKSAAKLEQPIAGGGMKGQFDDVDSSDLVEGIDIDAY